MKGKRLLMLGVLLAGQALWQPPSIRKAARKGAVRLIQEALRLMDKGRYYAVLTKEEAEDLWAEVEFRHRMGRVDAIKPTEFKTKMNVKTKQAM